MQIIVKTKSNFRNLNGQWLTVKERRGDRVSVIHKLDEFSQPSTIDFARSEIVDFNIAGIKNRDIVQLDKKLGLISLKDQHDIDFKVIDFEASGLISQPFFVKVADMKGNEHLINPTYLLKS